MYLFDQILESYLIKGEKHCGPGIKLLNGTHNLIKHKTQR